MTNDESDMNELSTVFQTAAETIEPSAELRANVQRLGEPVNAARLGGIETVTRSRFSLAAISAAAILFLIVASTVVIVQRGGDAEITTNGTGDAASPEGSGADAFAPPTTGDSDSGVTIDPEITAGIPLPPEDPTATTQGRGGRNQFMYEIGLFTTPSGDVTCSLDSGVTCSISEKDWEVLPQDRPSGNDCESEGATIRMDGDGLPEFSCIDRSDWDLSKLATLQYGDEIQTESVTCSVREFGLMCWNNQGGAFVMSEGEYPLEFAQFWSSFSRAVATDDSATLDDLIAFDGDQGQATEPTPAILLRDFKEEVSDPTLSDVTEESLSGEGFFLVEQNLLTRSSTGVTFSATYEDRSGGVTTEHVKSLLFERTIDGYKLVELSSAG